jgi:mucin-6/19
VGLDTSEGRSRPILRQTTAIFLLVVLAAAIVPSAATVYQYEYANPAGAVRAPSVSLVGGTTGSSSVSAAANSASATATSSLAFYENASATTSSVAIDGSSSASTNGKKSSLAVTITTTKANDLVYLFVSLLTGTTVSGVADTSGLTWASRQTEDANGARVEAWYAVSSAVLTGDTVTVTPSASDKFSATIFGVSGTNTASPFDPNFSTAPVNTGSGASGSVTLTTTYANDLIVAGVTVAGGPTVTATSPLALIAPAQTETASSTGAAGYDQVTSMQSSSSFSFSWGATDGWSMVADAFAEGIPAASSDTSVITPGTSGSFSLPALSSAYLWSPAYTAASTLYTGNWKLDIWGLGATSGTMNADVYIVDSSNAVVSTLVSSLSTATFGTAKGEVLTVVSAVPGTTIPLNDKILVVLTAPQGGPASFTVYWGSGQLSNFQTPSTYNYILGVSNGATSSWTLSLATTSGLTSNLGRLTNVTVWFTSPFGKQIVISGGALTQSSGPGVTLAGSGTVDIAVAAFADAIPTGSNVPSTVTLSLQVLNSGSTAYSLYTIVLTLN